MMAIYGVYKRFGSAHEGYYGEIKASTAKEAFKLALKKYYEPQHYLKYTAFYVQSQDKSLDGFDRGYGYDNYGQRGSIGYRSSAKWILDSA
jgi:hypothetical protein